MRYSVASTLTLASALVAASDLEVRDGKYPCVILYFTGDTVV